MTGALLALALSWLTAFAAGVIVLTTTTIVMYVRPQA